MTLPPPWSLLGAQLALEGRPMRTHHERVEVQLDGTWTSVFLQSWLLPGQDPTLIHDPGTAAKNEHAQFVERALREAKQGGIFVGSPLVDARWLSWLAPVRWPKGGR